MQPEDLNDFLDYTKDIRGYLIALSINFIGLDERLAPYLDMLGKVGKEEVDPVDFYEMLTQLYSHLGIIMTAYPKTEVEIMPCIRVVDELRKMFRMPQ